MSDQRKTTWQDWVTIFIYSVIFFSVDTWVRSPYVRIPLLLLIALSTAYHLVAMYRGET